MNHIRFLAMVRGVEREGMKRGYKGDVLAEAQEIPLVGNPQQQFDQCTIYADVQPRPQTERERAVLKRLVRAVVLTSPSEAEWDSVSPVATPAKSGRRPLAW